MLSHFLYSLLTKSITKVAHALGLDRAELPAGMMNDRLDRWIHSLIPPSFHAERITQMNYAIHQYQLILQSHLFAEKSPKQK